VPSTAHGFNASCNQYIVSRYFYRPYDIDVSDRVLDYEIGQEVFMLGGDSWELTDAAPDAIGHTWPVLIHWERGKERKHVQRGFWLDGWDHKVTVPTRI
jgi:hypothetical protein